MTSPSVEARNQPPIAALRWIYQSGSRAGRTSRSALTVAAFCVFVRLAFHLSLANSVSGIAVGALYGLVGVALVLTYRSIRIINFAAAAIGAVPAITALLLDIQGHLNYLEALPIAFLGGPVFGALVDIVVMRRFARSPRLIVTVVTVGVAQSLAALAFFIPIWLGARAGEIPTVPTPWTTFAFRNGRGQPVLSGNQIFAIGVTVALTVALALFLRYTRMGIALRASSENADRAALLGIPVKRVGTVAWMIAGLLAGAAIYVQSPLIGAPQDATLGFDTLLYGMAAAVVGRMEKVGITLAAGIGIGVLVFGSVTTTGNDNSASALMLVVIMLALLLQRGVSARAYDTGSATWQDARRFRPIPVELRNLRQVRLARWTIFAMCTAVMVVLPFVVGGPNVPALTVLPLYGIVAVSLVILSGWAGQISLGQFGLVGMSAAASGGLIANHNIDFFVAMGIGIGVGAFTAVLIGIPALRIGGLYLAVTTLAFGYAIQNYVLNRNYYIGRHILPSGLTAHLNRPSLWGRVDLESSTTFYFVCLMFMTLAIAAAMSYRQHRGARVLMAVRDNARAAASYSVSAPRTKLAAFAISGGIAGVAGVLFAYDQHSVIPGSYSVFDSIAIFLAVVVGGISSLPFAVSGALLLEASVLFGHQLDPYVGATIASILPLLLTGPVLVLNLFFYPGGTAEWGFSQRDNYLRRLARKHDIRVPALVADRRADNAEQHSANVLEEAEGHFHHVGKSSS